MTYPRTRLSDARGGLNTYDLPWDLQKGDGTVQFPALKGVFVNHVGRIRARGGHHQKIASQMGTIAGFRRFISDTVNKLMVAVDNGGSVSVKSFETNGTDNGVLSAGWATGKEISFATLYKNVFFGNGYARSQKWSGAGAAYKMGIDPPASACTSADGGAGNLIGTGVGYTEYTWYVTYVNADGTESNPSPASNPFAPASRQAALTAIPVSPDPQVTKRRIYRIGGTSGEYRFVAEIADNVTTTYTDNIDDIDLSLTILSFSHDVPGNALWGYFAHKNRLFAMDRDHPYRVWASSFQYPEYWPEAQEDPTIDGGWFDVGPADGDTVTGFGTLGSTLLIFKKHSIYALFGDSFDSGGGGYVLRKVSDKGCVARKSIVTCLDRVVFLSSDGMVYYLGDDNEPLPLSRDVYTTLSVSSQADMAGACAIYLDNRYILTVARDSPANAITLQWDFLAESWTELSAPSMAATNYDRTEGAGVGGEVWYSVPDGYTLDDGSAYSGVMSALSPDDTTSLVPVHIATPQFSIEERGMSNRARHLRIEGSYAPYDPAAPLYAVVTASTNSHGGMSVQHTYKAKRLAGNLIDCDLHSDLVGRLLQVEVYGDVKVLEINAIEMQYSHDLKDKD